MTMAAGSARLTAWAFAPASAMAMAAGARPRAMSGASTARSSIGAGIASKEMPAFFNSIIRAGLFEARISRAMIPSILQLGTGGLVEGDDVGRRFLDRTASHVDDRPAVAFAEFPGE